MQCRYGSLSRSRSASYFIESLAEIVSQFAVVLSCVLLTHLLCLVHFVQIDADFIAQYQMNYGCGETTNSDTSSQYTTDYWSNPPSDINSEEYCVWYEKYCSYFYSQSAAEADATTASATTTDSGLEVLQETANSSAVSTTTTLSVDTDKAADDSAAGDSAGGKKRKKKKKDDVANPKPSEPPGEFWLGVHINFNGNRWTVC